MILTFQGGLNENQNPSIYEANAGYNFELGLYQSKLSPRKPFDLKGTATNAQSINGLLQLVKRDNTETTLVQAGDTVYQWDGANVFTSKGTVSSTSRLRDTYWSLGDYLVVTDITKATVVQKWDGTTFGNLTTGLSDPLYAKYGVVHNNRVWLFNVKTTTDTPHLMVASAYEDPQTYDTSKRAVTGSFSTGLEAFYILTPDLKPINGVAVFHNQLIVSTEQGRLFQLTGTDAKTYTWVDFYDGSSAIGTESMVNMGDDVIYMRRGGKIDTLLATQKFGDVETNDVSRWMPVTTKDLQGALSVYDQTNQKVLLFVSGKVLVLFKNLYDSQLNTVSIGAPTPQLSPWSVYTTSDPSGFNTNAAKYMRIPSTTNLSVYWGDSTGRIFDMNGQLSGDAGTYTIPILRKTKLIQSNQSVDGQQKPLNFRKGVLRGTVNYRRNGQFNLTVSFDWMNEYNVSSGVIGLKGPPTNDTAPYYNLNSYYNLTSYFNQGFAFANKVSSQNFSPTGKGDGFFLSLSADTAVQFQVDSLDIET